MMIIDVRKLNAGKTYSGRLEFEYMAPESLIDIPFVRFSAPVKVEAEFELYEDDSRCLKEASERVEGEIDAYFQPFEDGEDYSYSSGIIHLEDAVNDAIMASMPRTLSCGENCQGIRY